MREYCSQEQRVANWLDARPGIAVLPLEYDAILADPLGTAEAVAAFLSGFHSGLLGRSFEVAAAAQAVDPALKRQAGNGNGLFPTA